MTDPETAERLDRIRAEHTALLEQIAREAVAAWREAQWDANPEPDPAGRRGAGRTGANPALLGQAIRALADVRAIWGAQAAGRPTGPGEQDLAKEIVGVDFEDRGLPF